MNTYSLISEIYRLLGELDQSTLNGALAQELPREIRSVIRALIDARRSLDDISASTPAPQSIPSEKSSPPTQNTAPSNPEVAVNKTQTEQARVPQNDLSAIDSISVITRNLTNDQLIRALQKSGLPLRVNVKDSRQAILRKVRQALVTQPAEKRKKTMASLRKIIGVDETAGWLEVIHPSRDQ